MANEPILKSERDWLASEERRRKEREAQAAEWKARYGAVPGTSDWDKVWTEKHEVERLTRHRDEILKKIRDLEKPEFYNPPTDRPYKEINTEGLKNFTSETGIYETPTVGGVRGFSNIGSVEGIRPMDRPEKQTEYDRLSGLIGRETGKGKAGKEGTDKRAELLLGAYNKQIEGLAKTLSGLSPEEPQFAIIQKQMTDLQNEMKSIAYPQAAPSTRPSAKTPWSITKSNGLTPFKRISEEGQLVRKKIQRKRSNQKLSDPLGIR